MPSVFTHILTGEVSRDIVWRDDRAFAIVPKAPIAPGHTLVIPVDEVDHWTDLEPELLAYLMHVARRIGRALTHAYGTQRAALAIVGFGVPHAHLHVVPIDDARVLRFTDDLPEATPEEMADTAARIRHALLVTTSD